MHSNNHHFQAAKATNEQKNGSVEESRCKQVRRGLCKTRSPCRPWVLGCSHVSVMRTNHFILLNQLLRLNKSYK